MPYVRTITASDPDGSAVPALPTHGAIGITIGGTALAVGASLTFRIISCDGAANVQGVSCPYTLSTGPAADWGARFLGVPNTAWELPILPIQAEYVYVKVDVCVGSWTLSAAPQYPPGQTKPWA